MSLETVTVSKQAKDQLVWLKRWTKLENWNVLCRWALISSLAEPSVPPRTHIAADSNVEMTWKTFTGEHPELYLALLRMRCKRDGIPLDSESLAQQLKLHLHRGIGYLAGDRGIRSIGDLYQRLLSRRRR
jgi:DNA sulfur modification protein DndE